MLWPHTHSILSQVAVGAACASYWRGAWYILDDHLYPSDPLRSAMASLGLGTVGLSVSQIANERLGGVGSQMPAGSKTLQQSVRWPGVARFGAMYGMATSCVLVWRGAWMAWDVAYERFHERWDVLQDKTSAQIEAAGLSDPPAISATSPGHLTKSGVASHFAAAGGLLVLGYFSLVLAPPACPFVMKDVAVQAAARATRSARLPVPKRA